MQLRHVRQRMCIYILCGILAFSLTACGGSAPEEKNDSKQTDQVEKSTKAPDKEEETAGKDSEEEEKKGEDPEEDEKSDSDKDSDESDGEEDQKEIYRAPAFQEAVYHPEEAEGTDEVKVDLSMTQSGYIGVSAMCDAKMKFQVIKDGQTYTYDLASDGTPGIYPLQLGDGKYQFRAVENVSGTKYAMVYQGEVDVKMYDEFQPFLRPSDYVSYKEDSLCVQKAKELAGKATGENEVVAAVYDYICKSVNYDKDKAKNATTGYLPVPDETMKSGKGICFDYASLAAAMLRSQGIPAKVIFGYVAPNDLYHAWNMFYTEEDGWVTVDYKVNKNNWNRLDLTFSANGADEEFIGDGTNYTDVYFY